MPYIMVVFSESVLLGGELLLLELHDDLRYRMRYGELLEYWNGRRKVRGRTGAYELRSVEQLRYDFEKDIADA